MTPLLTQQSDGVAELTAVRARWAALAIERDAAAARLAVVTAGVATLSHALIWAAADELVRIETEQLILSERWCALDSLLGTWR